MHDFKVGDENIAVHCPTLKLFKEVKDKSEHKCDSWHHYGKNTCLNMSGDKNCMAYGQITTYGNASVRPEYRHIVVISAEEYLSNREHPFPKPLILKEKEENNMKKCIEEAYPNSTKDANLVEKWSLALGITSTFIGGLVLIAHKEEVLVEAERLEAVAEENAKKE